MLIDLHVIPNAYALLPYALLPYRLAPYALCLTPYASRLF